MSNGFPYFQFHVDRWLTGKISAFDFEEQGFFLHLCMLAWVARGAFNVCSTSVQRRFKKTAAWVSESVAAFAEVGIIARDGDRWRIKFIDEQLRDLGELRDKRSKAGRASAAARAAETPPAPPSATTDGNELGEKSREEKSSVLNTRSTGVEHVLNNAGTAGKPPDRPKTFKTWTPADLITSATAANADGLLSVSELAEFVGYWTEPMGNGKPRCTGETAWDTRRRVQTWRRNEDKRAVRQSAYGKPNPHVLSASQRANMTRDEIDAHNAKHGIIEDR
jgi:hypothetical protein